MRLEKSFQFGTNNEEKADPNYRVVNFGILRKKIVTKMVDTTFMLWLNPFTANLFIVIPSYYSSGLEEASKYAGLITPQHSKIKFYKQF